MIRPDASKQMDASAPLLDDATAAGIAQSQAEAGVEAARRGDVASALVITAVPTGAGQCSGSISFRGDPALLVGAQADLIPRFLASVGAAPLVTVVKPRPTLLARLRAAAQAFSAK